MCFDSLNSSDIACGEYASRTLAGKQAPSMAKTNAIDSKQCRRAKPKGSPTLFCALGSRFWGENPDERRFFCISSGFLGRFPGRVSLLHTPWQDYGQKVTEVYRKTSSKHCLGYRLVAKHAKCGQGVSGQAQIRMLPDVQSQHAEIRVFYDVANNSRRKSECFTICYTNKHKPRSASL